MSFRMPAFTQNGLSLTVMMLLQPQLSWHLGQNSHPLVVFDNNHGTEVDIWGARKLIVDAVVFSSVISPVVLQRNINVKCKINVHTTI
jgi:hypothetical protein